MAMDLAGRRRTTYVRTHEPGRSGCPALLPLLACEIMEDAVVTTGRILRLARDRGLPLREDSAVLDDTGWDFFVVHATAEDGSPWILRVPRRPDVATLARAEQRLLALLHSRFSIAIPDWQLADAELIAYPRLAGEPAALEDAVTFRLHWRIDRA